MKKLYIDSSRILDFIDFLESNKYDNILTGKCTQHRVVEQDMIRVDEFVWDIPNRNFLADLYLKFDKRDGDVQFADFFITEYGTETRVNYYSKESNVIRHLLSYYTLMWHNNLALALDKHNELSKSLEKYSYLFNLDEPSSK